MRYKAEFTGRKINAIGRMCQIVTQCAGTDENDARLRLYEHWEHIMHLKLTPIAEGEIVETTMRCVESPLTRKTCHDHQGNVRTIGLVHRLAYAASLTLLIDNDSETLLLCLEAAKLSIELADTRDELLQAGDIVATSGPGGDVVFLRPIA